MFDGAVTIIKEDSNIVIEVRPTFRMQLDEERHIAIISFSFL